MLRHAPEVEVRASRAATAFSVAVWAGVWCNPRHVERHLPAGLRIRRARIAAVRRARAADAAFGGAELDPVTRNVSTLYQSDTRNFFYTGALGKQQLLPNRNILITEAQPGRAFEVTPEGEVVWSYINRWDADEVAWIEEATRYPMHYAAFAREKC